MEVTENLKHFLENIISVKEQANNVKEFFSKNPEIEKKYREFCRDKFLEAGK